MTQAPPSAANASCLNRSPLLSFIHSMRQDPSGSGFSNPRYGWGFSSFDGNRRVLSYRALSPVEIAEVVKIFPAHVRTQLEQRLEGVDGRNVTDLGDLLHPSSDLMPSFGDSDGLGYEAGADQP